MTLSLQLPRGIPLGQTHGSLGLGLPPSPASAVPRLSLPLSSEGGLTLRGQRLSQPYRENFINLVSPLSCSRSWPEIELDCKESLSFSRSFLGSFPRALRFNPCLFLSKAHSGQVGLRETPSAHQVGPCPPTVSPLTPGFLSPSRLTASSRMRH